MQKFKSYGIQDVTEEAIEVAIMSVLCNLKISDLEEVLKTVLKESISDDDNKYIDLFKKYFDVTVF